jgi:signal peptidase II
MRPHLPTSPNGRTFWIAAASVVVLDVITKRLAERLLVASHPVEVLGEVGRLTLVYNTGAAFSMSLGDYNRLIFGAFAVLALVILWQLYRQSAPGERMRVLALGLAWGGAAGNLIDRLRGNQGVVDFIDIGVGDVRFWTFNVADSAVTIGAIALALVLWREDKASAGKREDAAQRKAGEPGKLEGRTGT